jgi:hypothetical protein
MIKNGEIMIIKMILACLQGKAYRDQDSGFRNQDFGEYA